MAFHFPRDCIVGTNHCGKKCHELFQWKGSYLDVKCFHYDEKQLLASFANQIEYEYYGGNGSVSI